MSNVSSIGLGLKVRKPVAGLRHAPEINRQEAVGPDQRARLCESRSRSTNAHANGQHTTKKDSMQKTDIGSDKYKRKPVAKTCVCFPDRRVQLPETE